MCKALGYSTPDLDDYQPEGIYFLNLRGSTVDLENIGNFVIHECERLGIKPKLIIFDSLYMLSSGDENGARQVTNNMNIISRVAQKTGAGVIATHHTTKGSQSSKSIIDMASGSGAFGRHVDVNITLKCLKVPQEGERTAWRLVFGKTRHTKKLPPVNLWYDYPRHIVDKTGMLNSAGYSDDVERNGKTTIDRESTLLDAYNSFAVEGIKSPKVVDLIERTGKPETTVKNWIGQSSLFEQYKPDGERAHRVRLKELAPTN